ncbi:hypothetical protein DM77_3446 [Burkholderia mallei]|nr:hypothetical protein DM77_3446 [Burkholderia mallei]
MRRDRAANGSPSRHESPDTGQRAMCGCLSVRCSETPSVRSNSHPPVLLYATPNSRSISLRTRASVHCGLAKPAASAPSSSIARSVAHCAEFSRRGRPGAFAMRPSRSASRFAHLQTDCRDTTSLRATSACGMPDSSKRKPSVRRSAIGEPPSCFVSICVLPVEKLMDVTDC